MKIQIDGSSVIIKEGDLFEEEGYKAIGFNEYFDTQVDNRIISEHSLNGIFINTICANKT
ncbi:macro domain-containing protein, partial [Phocaeicola dorei]|uniref:macro domain-containing protein n=3 Tax=Bacteroidaceae TaxID=815 RepID=UPI00397BB50B